VIIISYTALALVKLSFLLFYKRIFVYDHRSWTDLRRVTISVMIVIIILWDLGFSLTMFASCPGDLNARFSTKTSKEIMSKCINTFLVLYGFAISDFITDALIILIPLLMIWKLHLPLR
jgi:hypothetical protein